jgi:hypothetical protein
MFFDPFNFRLLLVIFLYFYVIPWEATKLYEPMSEPRFEQRLPSLSKVLKYAAWSSELW